jgi:bidirectional [NiFe] hydrogenase diaphorase subunit
MILEFLLAHAPNSPQLQELAQEYGADQDRFEKESSFCILCGLCVRYCAEVKKKDAVRFVECGARREIRFIPEIAAGGCPVSNCAKHETFPRGFSYRIERNDFF